MWRIAAIFILALSCTAREPEASFTDTDELAERFYETFNRYRVDNGQPPLGVCSPLEIAAKTHAMDMYYHAFFSHIGTDGRDYEERASGAGYDQDVIGELLLKGPRGRDMRALLRRMLDSAESRDIALHPMARCMGVGYQLAYGDGTGNYWSLLLGQ